MYRTVDVDPLTLSYDERMRELQSCERKIAALHARQLRLLAALQVDPPPQLAEKSYVREDVQLTMRWSESRAANLLATAEAVTGPLSDTLDALHEGAICLAQVEAIAGNTFGRSDEVATELQARVLEFATTRDLSATRRKLDREMRRLIPEEESCEEARANRRVWSKPDGIGTSFVGAVLPAEGAATLMHALSFMASQKAVDDERTKDQRMADALVQLGADVLARGCSHCELPARALGPAVTVTVALSTLLGLDEEAGELNGEPIPAILARNLADDAHGRGVA